MKKRLLSLILISIIVISCAQQSEKPAIKELSLPDEFTTSMIASTGYKKHFATIFTATNTSYDPEFGYSLDLTDRLVTIKLGEQYVAEEANRYPSYEDFTTSINKEYELEHNLFPEEDGYEVYCYRHSMPRLSAGIYEENDEYYPAFFKFRDDAGGLMWLEGGAVDVINYKGIFAYEQRVVRICSPGNAAFLCFLYLLTFLEEESNPYDIYFCSKPHDYYRVFLIPKNERFQKNCISKIENEPGMQYYDIEQAREIIKKKEEEGLPAKICNRTIHYY